MKNFLNQTILVGALAVSLTISAQASDAKLFASPQAAVMELTNAAIARDTNLLESVFGSGLRDLVSSDAVQSSNNLTVFARRVSQSVSIGAPSNGQVMLAVGYEAWPFPIPLMQEGNQWRFNLAAGREEILNRRIGANELGALAVLHAYIDAQREYARADRDGNGVLEYAQHLRSTTGKHDGLYWHAEAGEAASPFGPLIAESHEEGYHKENKIMAAPQSPYHGYYFKILTKQGSHAAGGKYNYVVHGKMVSGFAMVAWPSEWNNSGVMTFMVNHQGKIFEKNLGLKTSSLASHMTTFDPDSTWKQAWEP